MNSAKDQCCKYIIGEVVSSLYVVPPDHIQVAPSPSFEANLRSPLSREHSQRKGPLCVCIQSQILIIICHNWLSQVYCFCLIWLNFDYSHIQLPCSIILMRNHKMFGYSEAIDRWSKPLSEVRVADVSDEW